MSAARLGLAALDSAGFALSLAFDAAEKKEVRPSEKTEALIRIDEALARIESARVKGVDSGFDGALVEVSELLRGVRDEMPRWPRSIHRRHNVLWSIEDAVERIAELRTWRGILSGERA